MRVWALAFAIISVAGCSKKKPPVTTADAGGTVVEKATPTWQPSARLGMAGLRHLGRIHAFALLPKDQVLTLGMDPTAPHAASMSPTITLWAADGTLLRQVGHPKQETTSPHVLAISPDGTVAAIIEDSGDIALIEIATLNRLGTLANPRAGMPVSRVHDLCFLDDNNLVTTQDPGTVRRWDVKTRAETAQLVLDGGDQPAAVACSTDFIAFAIEPDPDGDRDTRVLGIGSDLSGKPSVVAVDVRSPEHVAISPDGSRVAVNSLGQIVIVPRAKGKRLVIGAHDTILSLGFLSATEIASAGEDRHVYVFEVATGKRLREIGDFEGSTMAVSRDGTRIAVGDHNGPALALFDAAGKPGLGAERHNGEIRDLDWDGKGRLVTLGRDAKLRRWDAAGKQLDDTAVGSAQAFALDATSEAGTLAAFPSQLSPFQLGIGRAGIFESQTEVKQVAYAGDTVLIARPDGVSRWDAKTRKVVGPAVPGGDLGLFVLADGNVAALGKSASAIVSPAGALVKTLALTAERSAAISRDGTRMAAGGDGKLTIHDSDGKLVHETSAHQAPIDALAFSPDGTLLASGDDAGRVIVWKVASLEQVAELPGHPGQLTALAFSPDGKLLASADDEGVAFLWSVP